MRYCYCFNYWFKSLYNFNNDRDYGSCKTSITLDTVTSPGCDDYRILCQLGALRGLRVLVLKKYKNKKKDNCLQASSAELSWRIRNGSYRPSGRQHRDLWVNNQSFRSQPVLDPSHRFLVLHLVNPVSLRYFVGVNQPQSRVQFPDLTQSKHLSDSRLRPIRVWNAVQLTKKLIFVRFWSIKCDSRKFWFTGRGKCSSSMTLGGGE